MVTPSGSCPAGSQAAAALGASENGLYVSFALALALLLAACVTAKIITPPAGTVDFKQYKLATVGKIAGFQALPQAGF